MGTQAGRSSSSSTGSIAGPAAAAAAALDATVSLWRLVTVTQYCQTVSRRSLQLPRLSLHVNAHAAAVLRCEI
jgi:hypothetical protein